jgi:zona occludens toxin
MINLILGAPGGGKSYEAVVFHVLPALEEQRKIITNLPLNIDYIYRVIPEARGLIEIREPTPENLKPFSQLHDYGDQWRHPETGIGPLYIIDECHVPLPSRDTPREVEEWYAMHRHELSDVLLMTQSYGKVNRPIIDLVQLVYRVRKGTALGSNEKYIRKVQDGIRGSIVNSSIRKYKKQYFPFYNSHTKSNKSAQEAFAKDITPIWRHWSVIGAAACFLFTAYAISQGWFNLFEQEEVEITEEPNNNKKTSKLVRQAKHIEYSQNLPTTQKPSKNGKAISEPELLSEKEIIEKYKKSVESKKHPLYKVNLHILGSAQNERQKKYLLAAAQNGQTVFRLETDELAMMGYEIKGLSPCALKLTYGEYSDWLTCDSPRVGMKGAVGEAGRPGGDPARGEGARSSGIARSGRQVRDSQI